MNKGLLLLVTGWALVGMGLYFIELGEKHNSDSPIDNPDMLW